ncbi:MAG: hypothetical protein AB7F22_25470 [Reyranella sp.]|uniref:hypothetical protein n=1 Tax=Reyranella sp. TaxID=1929291 RepID=UPI003D0E4CEA
MSRSDQSWPTRRGRRKPLDVIAAHEELSKRLRRRFLDGLEAEAEQSPPGSDATKHINAYTKALDGLTKLQFDTGQLERVTPVRGGGSPEAVPSGRSIFDYTLEERRQMDPEWIGKGIEPDPGSKVASDPACDDD